VVNDTFSRFDIIPVCDGQESQLSLKSARIRWILGLCNSKRRSFKLQSHCDEIAISVYRACIHECGHDRTVFNQLVVWKSRLMNVFSASWKLLFRVSHTTVPASCHVDDVIDWWLESVQLKVPRYAVTDRPVSGVTCCSFIQSTRANLIARPVLC